MPPSAVLTVKRQLISLYVEKGLYTYVYNYNTRFIPKNTLLLISEYYLRLLYTM